MKNLINNLKLGGKKSVENLVIILVLVIIVMIVINSLFAEENLETENEFKEEKSITKSNDSLEENLASILSTIKGVDEAIVKIPLYDTKEVTTITKETDSNGGERMTEETSNEYKAVFEEENSNKKVLIKQSIMPEIIGVIVTCEGAENNIIKENIINAVSAVTNVALNKIQVFVQ